MNYYKVGLAADRHWNEGVFTYASEEVLDTNTIVRVPFGRSKKFGFVIEKTTKPTFQTKQIESQLRLDSLEDFYSFRNWYSSYYADNTGTLYAQFLPNYLTAKPQVQELSAPKQEVPDLQLTTAQMRVVAQINKSTKPSVLHGITGSGKTRIYIELLKSELEKGRNGLLLYPEIALTPQIVKELSVYAPLLVFHSQMSDTERSRMWHTIATVDKPHIVVGPRSALFLPHKNLGIIIIDEAHESTYKQDTDIRYNSLHVAGGLANAHRAKLVIASATPPITETEQILSRGGELVCLHEKAIDTERKKSAQIVDQRVRENFKKHPLISDVLINSISQAISEKQQTLMFINRRGTAKLVVCSSDTCEWQATCSSCELPMTFHHDSHILTCHTCGRKQKMPQNCPVCSSDLSQKIFGTKAFVNDIEKLFPHASIARFDSDNTKDESFAQRYEEVSSGKVDIIIGTQQLVKGLDLPRLGVVGVLHADLSLNFPDFSSDERTFQLIAQVLGRVGRGHQDSVVVLQTRQPNNPVIRKATDEDWHGFREVELTARKRHGFPPYTYLGKLLFREKSIEKGFKKAEEAREAINKIAGVSIDGPLLSFFAKRGNFYYTQLHLRSTSRAKILDSVKKSPKGTIADIDPDSLL
ncbi:primosomal protein N' [Candidatus Saccharibacteria bacterium]|nr:primosomal protein N' [Candidatus Saccharibacteria bacterium]MCA9328303.1 primosomal protein N' [Candidatus Saccharibacteria bacterium]